MGKKRGGLAGIWDRNKKIIKPVVSGIAGLVGTPALGAAVGAAMGGLDREGKSGIGFDAKQGLRGAVSGYGAGSLGAGLGSLAGKAGLNVGQGSLNRFGGSGLRSVFGKGVPAPVAPPVGAPPAPPPIGAINPPPPVSAGFPGVGNGVPTDLLPVNPAGLSLANPAPPVSFPSAPGAGRIPLQSGVMGDVSSGAAQRAASSTALGRVPAAVAPRSALGSFWDSVKPQMGTNKDGSSAGNLGAYGAALDYLGNRGAANAAQQRAESEGRLTDAQIAQMEYERKRQEAKDASLQRLRESLSASMPNFNVVKPPWAP